MSGVYLPVRECRRVFEERYSEQLTFTAEDIAPWLILAGVSDPIRAGAAYTPRRPPNPRQTHHTTGSGRNHLDSESAAGAR